MTVRPVGRPPAVWLTPADLEQVEPGTAVSIDVSGKHRARLVGRVLRPHPEHPGTIILRDRDAHVVEVVAADTTRFRILDRVFPVGRGVWHLSGDQRVVVVDVRDRDHYLVEDPDGTRHWVFEGDLAERAPGLPPLKRGRPATDPVTEALNAEAVAAREWAR